MNKIAVYIALAVVLVVFLTTGVVADAAGPQKEPSVRCSRYSLPQAVTANPFHFADELVPIQRPDVRSRILFQTNFLLLDARSVLTDWLSEKSKYAWLFEELLAKEGIPKDFVWLAPIMAGASLKSQTRQTGLGWWSLEKTCASSDGVEMSEDSWHDDRLDLELATRCFASRMKQIRHDLGDAGWLMTAAAYISGQSTVQDLMRRWNTKEFWDLPLPDPAEELVVRWIALRIIAANRGHFGLNFRDSPPLVFDQVTGLVFNKDLPVAEVARMVGLPSREILELNPKVKPSSGVFPAQIKGKTLIHSIAVPKGKGAILLEKLKAGGYVSGAPKS